MIRKKQATTIVAVTAALSVISVRASAAQIVYGFGNQSCSHWNAAKAQDSERLVPSDAVDRTNFITWTLAYLSGANFMRRAAQPDILAGVDTGSLINPDYPLDPP